MRPATTATRTTTLGLALLFLLLHLGTTVVLAQSIETDGVLNEVSPALLGTSGAAVMGKGNGKGGGAGGSGAPPPGRIAYSAGDSIVMIDADGGNPSTTVVASGSGRLLATRALHGGQASFLRTEFEDLTPGYPDGRPVRDLVIYGEAGQRTALTALDGGMQMLGSYSWSFDAQRGIEDGVVLFTARRFDTAGQVVEAGIYSLQAAFATDGSIVGALPGSLVLVAPAPLMAYSDRGLIPDAGGMSANGTGTELVYIRISDDALMRTTFPTSSSTHTPLGLEASEVAWSPAEDLIALSASLHLYTADADGSNLRRLARGRERHTTSYDGFALRNPVFSPDGAHIAFKKSQGPYESAPELMTKDGQGRTAIAQQFNSVAGWTDP